MAPSIEEDVYAGARVADLPGGRLCYVRQGAGRPVVLIHGIPLSIQTWRHNLGPLARHHDVVAVDLPGYGRSQKQGVDSSTSSHVSAVLGLIRSLGLENVSLVASSYGCAVAVELARQYPGEIERLVLINSVGVPFGRHSLERFLRMRVARAVVRSALGSRFWGRRMFSQTLRRSYASPRFCNQVLVDTYFAPLEESGSVDAYLTTLTHFDEAAVLRSMSALRSPTLVLWGAHDRILSVKHSKRVAEQIAGARLAVLNDAGHLPHEEAAEEVNRHILSFLRGDSAQ